MNRYLNLLLVFQFSFLLNLCSSVEEKALQNAESNLCPNVGILDMAKVNENALFESNNKIAVKTKSGERKIYRALPFFNAKKINNDSDYSTFLRLYDEVCGGLPPFNDEIPYFIKMQKKDSELAKEAELKNNITQIESCAEKEKFHGDAVDICITKLGLLELKDNIEFRNGLKKLSKDYYSKSVKDRKREGLYLTGAICFLEYLAKFEPEFETLSKLAEYYYKINKNTEFKKYAQKADELNSVQFQETEIGKIYEDEKMTASCPKHTIFLRGALNLCVGSVFFGSKPKTDCPTKNILWLDRIHPIYGKISFCSLPNIEAIENFCKNKGMRLPTKKELSYMPSYEIFPGSTIQTKGLAICVK